MFVSLRHIQQIFTIWHKRNDIHTVYSEQKTISPWNVTDVSKYWLDVCHQIFYLSEAVDQSIFPPFQTSANTRYRKCSGTHQYKNYQSEEKRRCGMNIHISLAFRPIKLDSEIRAKSPYLWCSWLGPITILFLLSLRYTGI